MRTIPPLNSVLLSVVLRKPDGAQEMDSYCIEAIFAANLIPHFSKDVELKLIAAFPFEQKPIERTRKSPHTPPLAILAKSQNFRESHISGYLDS